MHKTTLEASERIATQSLLNMTRTSGLSVPSICTVRAGVYPVPTKVRTSVPQGKDKRAVDFSRGDKADGWYVFGIVPVIKSKLHAKARYNMYRPEKLWSTSKTMYEVGLNYYFSKNIQLNFEYARVNDRTATKHNYNFVDLELDFRF